LVCYVTFVQFCCFWSLNSLHNKQLLCDCHSIVDSTFFTLHYVFLMDIPIGLNNVDILFAHIHSDFPCPLCPGPCPHVAPQLQIPGAAHASRQRRIQGGHGAMPPNHQRFYTLFNEFSDIFGFDYWCKQWNNHIHHAMYIVFIHSQSELWAMFTGIFIAALLVSWSSAMHSHNSDQTYSFK